METSAFNEGEVIPSVQPLSRVIAFSNPIALLKNEKLKKEKKEKEKKEE